MNKNNILALFVVFLGVVSFVAGLTLFGFLIVGIGVLLQLKCRGVIKHIFPKVAINIGLETKVLRFCMVGYWIVSTLAIVASLYEEQGLPTAVVKFGESEIDLIPTWLWVLLLASFLIFMIGSIGVFFLKRWGRTVFVFGLIGLLFIAPFSGASLMTPMFGLLDGVGDIITGIILCLSYFTPAKQHFES